MRKRLRPIAAVCVLALVLSGCNEKVVLIGSGMLGAGLGTTVYFGMGLAPEGYEVGRAVMAGGLVVMVFGGLIPDSDQDSPPDPFDLSQRRSRYGPQVLISPNGATLAFRF